MIKISLHFHTFIEIWHNLASTLSFPATVNIICVIQVTGNSDKNFVYSIHIVHFYLVSFIHVGLVTSENIKSDKIFWYHTVGLVALSKGVGVLVFLS